MQITAPTRRAVASSRVLSGRTVTSLPGHRRRASLHLPWQFNAAIAGLIGFGIVASVLLQL